MEDVALVFARRFALAGALNSEIALHRKIGEGRRDVAESHRATGQRAALARRKAVGRLVLHADGPSLWFAPSRPEQPEHVDRYDDRHTDKENVQEVRHAWVANHRVLPYRKVVRILPDAQRQKEAQWHKEE